MDKLVIDNYEFTLTEIPIIEYGEIWNKCIYNNIIIGGVR